MELKSEHTDNRLTNCALNINTIKNILKEKLSIVVDIQTNSCSKHRLTAVSQLLFDGEIISEFESTF